MMIMMVSTTRNKTSLSLYPPPPKAAEPTKAELRFTMAADTRDLDELPDEALFREEGNTCCA